MDERETRDGARGEAVQPDSPFGFTPGAQPQATSPEPEPDA